ncbi:MAG: thioredoxin family protein [Gaiellaceae bacterium]
MKDDEKVDDRPLLVFFSSVRSGPARRMDSLLDHIARKERRRLRFLRVDADENPAVAERFAVADVPAIVVVRDKRVVARIVGKTSAPSIERALEPFLPAEEESVAAA